MERALAEIPTGGWTTYGDVAALIGSHPVPVGARLSTVRTRNAHRVLTAEGRISDQFRWTDPDDKRDPRQLLIEEGVRFDEKGIAEPQQLLDASELAALVGLDAGAVEVMPGRGEVEVTEGLARFLAQAGERQGPIVVGAMQRLIQEWSGIGGVLDFGSSSETSCFFVVQRDARTPWPFNIYPYGSIEVVFQWMRTRPPFDNQALREEMRSRLNAASDIEIPRAKLELRPSFPMRLLVDSDTFDIVRSTLEWFYATAKNGAAIQPIAAS
jgi:alkylated DNA nucleotide flippase Atl1